MKHNIFILVGGIFGNLIFGFFFLNRLVVLIAKVIFLDLPKKKKVIFLGCLFVTSEIPFLEFHFILSSWTKAINLKPKNSLKGPSMGLSAHLDHHSSFSVLKSFLLLSCTQNWVERASHRVRVAAMTSAVLKRSSYSAMRSVAGALAIGGSSKLRAYAAVAAGTDIVSAAPNVSLQKARSWDEGVSSKFSTTPLKDIFKVLFFFWN